MPNLTVLSNPSANVNSAVREAIGFGTTGNPTVRGTLRKFLRKAKHTVGDIEPSSYRKEKLRLRNAALDKTRTLQREFQRGSVDLKSYPNYMDSMSKKLHSTQGGESAVRSLDSAHGTISGLERLPNSSKMDLDSVRDVLRQTNSGEEAAQAFKRWEESRFRDAASSSYRKHLSAQRAQRHADKHTILNNASVQRFTDGVRTMERYAPAAYVAGAAGVGGVKDYRNRSYNARGEVSPNQKSFARAALRSDDTLKNFSTDSKQRKKILRSDYEDIAAMPSESRALELGAGALGTVGGLKFLHKYPALLGTHPLIPMATVVGSTLGASALAHKANEIWNRENREKLKSEVQNSSIPTLRKKIEALK